MSISDWASSPSSYGPFLLDFCEDGAPANYTKTKVFPIRFLEYGVRDDCLLVRLETPFEPPVFGKQYPPFETCVLVTRHQGETLFDGIDRPKSVYVLRAISDTSRVTRQDDPLDYEIEAWAELRPCE